MLELPSQERLHNLERTVTIDEVHSLHPDPVSRFHRRQVVEVEAAVEVLLGYDRISSVRSAPYDSSSERP